MIQNNRGNNPLALAPMAYRHEILRRYAIPVAILALTVSLLSIDAQTAKRPQRPLDVKTRPWYHHIEKSEVKTIIPEIKLLRLENGIEVYFLGTDAIPLVSLQVIVEGGGFEVPVDKLGLQSLWGESVIYSGSQENPQDKLADFFEARGTIVSFAAGLERSGYSLNSLSHYFKRDLETFFEVIQHPRFNASDVELLKAKMLQELEHRDENPSKWASLGLNKITWRGTIKEQYPTIRTVKPISPADLKNWHATLFRGERIKLAVSGKVNEADLKNWLNATFGKLATNTKNKVDLSAVKVKHAFKENSLFLLPKDIPQSTILYRAKGLSHTHKDYYALRILDFILGGDSFNSTLTQKIRTEKGWAYSTYSSFDTDDFTGSLLLFTQTANQNVPDVIREIDTILTNPESWITEQKIELAKISLKNKFVFLFENPAQYMKLYLQLKWDGLDDSYLPDFVTNLNKVKSTDVLRLAKTLYKPENFAILLCGPDSVYQQKSTLRPAKAETLVLEK